MIFPKDKFKRRASKILKLPKAIQMTAEKGEGEDREIGFVIHQMGTHYTAIHHFVIKPTYQTT